MKKPIYLLQWDSFTKDVMKVFFGTVSISSSISWVTTNVFQSQKMLTQNTSWHAGKYQSNITKKDKIGCCSVNYHYWNLFFCLTGRWFGVSPGQGGTFKYSFFCEVWILKNKARSNNKTQRQSQLITAREMGEMQCSHIS